VLNRPGLSREAALVEYQEERNVEVLKLQNSARNSTEWFETLDRYLHFEPIQFAYSLLTRSQRVSHENLRLRDKPWLEGVERWFQSKAVGTPVNDAAPPMFAPYKLRDMKLENRIVVSPMATYSAHDGTPNDFHLVHYGTRAQGGAGLVYTEMTCVSPTGRITPGCAGMYEAGHLSAWKRIVDFVHGNTKAKICLQLGHSGAKGSTRVGWEGYDVPLDDGNWPLIAASDVPWSAANQKPRPMTRADMDEVRDQFVVATLWGSKRGSTWSSSIAPTDICSPASSRRSRILAPTNMAGAWKTGCATRSRYSKRCAPPGLRRSRCRSGSRRPTGWASWASSPRMQWRSPAPSRKPAPI
jgi:anthraniloyl-CoA monooxygenase